MAGRVTFVFNPNTKPPSEQVNVNFNDIEACLVLLGGSEFTPVQITSDQDNFSTTDDESNLVGTLRLSSDASRTITGLAGGETGRNLCIINVGSFDIVLSIFYSHKQNYYRNRSKFNCYI